VKNQTAEFSKKIGPIQTQITLVDNTISVLFSNLVQMQAKKLYWLCTLLGIYFFNVMKWCAVITECLRSFSNSVWEGTNYHATFKHVFTYFFCNFSMVSRTSFVHIPASSFHVLHICSTICSGYQPICCDHTNDSFLRHSICFYGKKIIST